MLKKIGYSFSIIVALFFFIAFQNIEMFARESNSAAPPLEIGSRLELFVDGYLIDRTKNVQLKLHQPQSAGVAIKFDLPWEGTTGAYPTIIKDGETYRLYRRGGLSERDGSSQEVTLYAESKDGIHWDCIHR